MLMAYPGATLLGLTKGGLTPTTLEQTGHYRLMRDFMSDPKTFVESALWE
jgi:predicted ATPase